MESAGKILVDIASVSRKVLDMLVKIAGHKTVETFQLEKIVVASGAILETVNGALFLGGGTVDDRLLDWLSGDEPARCLEVLNRVGTLLGPRLDSEHGPGFGRFFRPSRSTSTKDKSNEAIKFLLKHESYFHFLLSTEIWNREYDTPRQLLAPPPPNVQRTYKPSDPNLAHVSQRKVGNPTCKAQERKNRGRRVDAKKLNATLKWLHAWNCSEIYERTLLLRQQDTCMWLLNMNAYKTWRNTENSFLWLHGKAGAGKSVLSASVIDDLRGSLQDGETLVYFYCDFRNERSTKAAEVMRSLLSQLLQLLHRRALDPGDLIDELIEMKDGGASTTNNVTLLARYISRAAKQFDQQPFLVVDALDECMDVEGLLSALAELRKGGSRLFVTSRPLQIIKDGLLGSASINMDMMKYEVSVDISLHVRRVLDSHRRLRIMESSLKNEIYSVLCEKADAMFRWAQCQLSSLERCMTAARVREVLNNLPNNLYETYERILLKTSEDESEGKVARHALDWLVVALSPLRLSQIIEGLSIDLNRRVLDHASAPVHGPALLDILGSLVTHNEVTDIIILSHFSVKEYLTSCSTRTYRLANYVDEQVAHKQLALLCMCYISIYLEQGQLSGVYDQHACQANMQVDHSAVVKSRVSPLLSLSSHFGALDEYVLSYGFHHLSHITHRDLAILRAIRILHLHAQQHPLEWDRLCKRSYSLCLWPTLEHDFMLFILIGYASASFLRSFIGRAQLKQKDGTNPLIYAARFGKIEHAQILLSSGVSSSHIGWDIWSGYHQLLPLEAAVEGGDTLMVDLLLAEGSPVPHKIFVQVLLRDRYIHTRIVSRLLRTDEFMEWATDGQDEDTILRASDPTRYMIYAFETSEQDVDDIQRRFVQLGRNPSTRFNAASLRYAVFAGHMSTVQRMLSLNTPFPPDIILDASTSSNSRAAMIRLWLDKGCDVNAVSPLEGSALHLVMSCHSGVTEDDHFESVQVLIDAGCDPSRCDLTGGTPLHLAAREGCLSIAQHLLSSYVSLPPDILLAASESQNAAMIRLLTSNGAANMHAIAADGDTPLHRVLQHSYAHLEEQQLLDCIKVLINSECDPCLPNATGKTPLDLAAENGYILVVQYLHNVLNSSFSPDVLLSVVGARSPEMIAVVKFLISKGADIRVTGPNGDTLLHLAMTDMTVLWETKCLSIIKILIDAGCDPHACNLAGETPFHTAARQGSTLAMEYLLSLGVSAPSDMMDTQFEGEPHTIPQRCGSVRFLLDRGGDIHAVAKNGDTLLHLAATLYPEQDALELAKRLVEVGCDPSLLNSKQETPFHIAARHGFISFIDYLLSLDIELPSDILLPASTSYPNTAQLIYYLVRKGASVFVSTAGGDTPLHLLLTSVEDSDEKEEDTLLESVGILVNAGCDFHAPNASGETPLHCVAKRGYKRILEYLLSKGAMFPHDILLAAGAVTILRFLLDNGFDLRSVTIDDATELMHRVLDADVCTMEHNVVKYAEILISAGWDPSLKNSAGETAIHSVARKCNIHAVKFFLSQNVPLPYDVLLAVVSSIGKVRTCSTVVALTRFFVREGASVNVVTSTGDTPLHLAMMHGFPSDRSDLDPLVWRKSWEVIEILLNAGSDPYSRNVDGQTPLGLAQAKGHFFKENFLRLVHNAHGNRLQ